jgi:D-3-phosphoglycerate dehydrogenase / 2-oxoglutarate reductase
MTSNIILIAASTHEWLINAFKQKGYVVIYEPKISYEEAVAIAPTIIGFVAGNRWAVDAQFINAATQLKWIGRLGSGMEKIDLVAASNKNIVCISSPEGNRQAVAEHALGMLLSLSKKITAAANEVKIGEWWREQNRGFEIAEKNIGIIGYGNTGAAFAKLLLAFNAKVLVYDTQEKNVEDNNLIKSTIEAIQEQCSIISLHIPYTKENHYFIGQNFFEKCTQQPIIINTSRGSVLDTQAAYNAMVNNKISGLALDVLENEKLDTYTNEEHNLLSNLLAMPNVLITPHIAGYSQEATFKMAQVLFEKLPL